MYMMYLLIRTITRGDAVAAMMRRRLHGVSSWSVRRLWKRLRIFGWLSG